MVEIVEDKVKKTIVEKGLLEKGDHIVVGISGGPDSVCLLSVLNNLAHQWQLTLYGVHVNHNLRGDDAYQDQIYTKDFCKKLGIPCQVFSHDVNRLSLDWKITTEEAGRRVRYEAFETIKKEIREDWGIKENVKIALAHNANDQAETLVMRIIRGTGTEGLAGMEYLRAGGIIRPLLDVSREEIEGYCHEMQLNPRIDLTNLEPLYTRNRIRLELLPLLQSNYNQNIISTLNRLALIAQEDREYFSSQVQRLRGMVSLDAGIREFLINLKEYRKLHPALAKRLILASLKEIGLDQDMTATHLDGADQLMRTGKTGDRMDLPWNYSLRISYEAGVFYRKGDEKDTQVLDSTDFSYPLGTDETIHIAEVNGLLKTSIFKVDSNKASYIKNGFTAHLDLPRLGDIDEIVVRNRRPGDYIQPLGMRGRKKLQDFFVDNKIPREKRNEVPLLCCGNEVIWIVGHRINENFKVTDSTVKILCLEYVGLT